MEAQDILKAEYPLCDCMACNFGKEKHYENMSVQYTAIFHGCKNVNFQMKKCDNFLIFAQRGGSNEYQQSMFWSKNKKICIPE